jgi:ketosteroid isomerase-like protein
MRLPILAAAAATFAIAAPGALAAPPSHADGQALRRLAAENDAAWTARDALTIAGQYVADGSVRVGHDANPVTGRASLRAFFEANFSQRQPGFRHVTEVDHIDMVAADTALADARVRVERANAAGGWDLVREFRTNSLLVRDGGVWRMRAVRAHPQASR